MTGQLTDIANELRSKAETIRRLADDLANAFAIVEPLGLELRESDLDFVRNRLAQIARQTDERAAVLDRPVTGHAVITIDPAQVV